MSLKEQKLFFTRNGNWLLWEMLCHLKDIYYDDLYDLCIGKKWTNTYPSSKDEFPSFLYTIYEELGQEEQEILGAKIEEFFSITGQPKSDFNAFIYKYIGVCLDIKSIDANLKALEGSIDQLDIEGLEMRYYLHQNVKDMGDIVDICFTSDKSLYYKRNDNAQLIHTEIRVYLQYNIALMTDFSQYTHSDSDKKKFILETLKRVSSFRSAAIEPLKLSSDSLKKLFVLEDATIPSKMKFNIEGRMKVGFAFDRSLNYEEILGQDEVKMFYDKYSLSVVRINLSDTEDKYITVDGMDGKLISRSHLLDVSDIDNFIKRLSVLITYDYLNHNYYKDILFLAKQNLIGPDMKKEQKVNTCYKEVEKTLNSVCTGVNSGVFVNVLRNSFFYCIKEGIAIKSEENAIQLNDESTAYLGLIVKVVPKQVNEVLNALLSLYKENNKDLSNLIVSIDDRINSSKRAIMDASGQ